MNAASHHRTHGAQEGFTLIELMIASIVFLIGISAVVQLIPAATESNLQNRVDTSSVVIAQRAMDQMTAQPLSSTSFTDADGNLCSLGSSANPNTVVGSSVTQSGNFVKIDFTAPQVSGYYYLFANPQNPTDGTYEVRWAVITQIGSNGLVASKRFIVGAQRRVGTQVLPSVSLDAWQQLAE